MSTLSPIDPASLFQAVEAAARAHEEGFLSSKVSNISKNQAPQLFIAESSSQQTQSRNPNPPAAPGQDNREEIATGRQDEKEFKQWVENAFMRIEQRDFAQLALDEMVVKISNTHGSMREEMEKTLSKMRFRDNELKEMEERKKQKKLPEEIKSNFNVDNSINGIKQLAAFYLKEMNAGMKLIAGVAQAYFDADGNEVDKSSAAPSIMKFDHSDMAGATSGMDMMFGVFEKLGFKVERQEYEKVDGQAQQKSATVFAVHLPEGFSTVNIFAMGQEDIEKALKMKQDGAKPSLENVVTGAFGSMDGRDLMDVFKDFSKKFSKEAAAETVQETEIEKESTYFREKFSASFSASKGLSSANSNNDLPTSFAARFGSSSGGGRGGR